ncbi:AsmA family protein [Falsiroseomonas bella]|nr:AsmA family protein [Falsiroseomonas bella]
MRRWARLLLFGAAGVALLFGGMSAALQLAISHGAFTAQLDAALERAIGRAVTHGEVFVRFGLRPRIALSDATIANIEGGSEADFARIGRLEVTLAPLPLLSRQVEIHSLLLADADILLERDAAGRPNWIFGRDRAAAPSEAPAGGLRIAELEIESSRIRLPGSPLHRIEIDTLTLARDDPDDPLLLDGRIRLNGEALSIEASLGAAADGALPLSARVTGQGLRLNLRGTWPRGTDQPAWSLALDAKAEPGTIRRLARSFAERELPLAPGPVAVTAQLGPGSPFPTVSDLKVRVGATDAGPILAGLRLSRAELRAASFEDPVAVSAQGRRAGAELNLVLALPSLRTMLEAPADEPWPVEATINAGPSRLTLAGAVRRDAGLGPAEFQARLVTPDLARAGQAFGVALPRLTGVTASARLSGLATREVRLAALSVTAQPLEGQGELTIGFASRPSLRGRFAMRRLDLDAFGADAPRRPGQPAQRLIPDIALPVEALRGLDAALTLSAATLRVGGVTWRDASTAVALANGRLVLDPLVATSPGGVLGGRFTLDAAAAPPAAALRIDSRGRGLDLVALRRAFGIPAAFEGHADLALDLRGRGATLPALAATLSGEAGIAMVGGRFTGATALSIGPDLSRALLPRGTPSGGLGLRCFALRLSADDGVAQSQALLAEGEFGRVDGSLALNLRNETLAARLLPDIRVMGLTIRTPVTVGGTFAAPRVGVEPGAALAQVVGDTVANRLWRSSTAEFLRGTTGSTPPGGDCASALTLARLGRAGRLPEPAPVPIPLVPREVQGIAQDVVRGFGGLLGGRRR